jgi:hypothetical protein
MRQGCVHTICTGASLISYRVAHSAQLHIITSIGSSSPLLGVKTVPLVDRSDLFKISNLVYDGRKL